MFLVDSAVRPMTKRAAGSTSTADVLEANGGQLTAAPAPATPQPPGVRRGWSAFAQALRTRTSEPALSTFYRAYAAWSGSSTRFALTRPLTTALAGIAILRLPIVEVVTSDTRSGHAVAEILRSPGPLHLQRRVTGMSVLTLPADPDDYRRGSSRRQLRKHLRHGEQRGSTWREVTDPAEREHLHDLTLAYEQVHPDPQYRNPAPTRMASHPEDVWLAVFGPDGEPLLLAIAFVDGGLAVLRYCFTTGSSGAHSESRYLVAQAFVEVLAARGVRSLATNEHPSTLSAGLAQFQHTLGYRLYRLRLHGASACEPN